MHTESIYYTHLFKMNSNRTDGKWELWCPIIQDYQQQTRMSGLWKVAHSIICRTRASIVPALVGSIVIVLTLLATRPSIILTEAASQWDPPQISTTKVAFAFAVAWISLFAIDHSTT